MADTVYAIVKETNTGGWRRVGVIRTFTDPALAYKMRDARNAACDPNGTTRFTVVVSTPAVRQ